MNPNSLSNNRPDRHVSRRDFLKLCGAMAATLALPAHFSETIARALTSAIRLPVVWLGFQGCTGDSESFLIAIPSSYCRFTQRHLDCLS